MQSGYKILLIVIITVLIAFIGTYIFVTIQAANNCRFEPDFELCTQQFFGEQFWFTFGYVYGIIVAMSFPILYVGIRYRYYKKKLMAQ
jgi:hypothetical protein